MELKLGDRRALVLGSSSGIGKAVAKVLADEGARVTLCSRSRERLIRAQEETGAASFVVADLGEPGAGRFAVEEAIAAAGGLDILVTNTGGPPQGRFEELQPGDWQKAHAGLWMSTVESMQAALPAMKREGRGRIVLITSVAAKEPVAGLTLSNAYRAGLLGMMNSLSKEAAPQGTTVNSILPGYTRTERLLELGLDLEALAGSIPARRLGEPEEIGKLAAFLCSDAAAYINGQAIACDGGVLQGL
jgi:3-oxoacyl-[acyl-carrier protein] reductase